MIIVESERARATMSRKTLRDVFAHDRDVRVGKSALLYSLGLDPGDLRGCEDSG